MRDSGEQSGTGEDGVQPIWLIVTPRVPHVRLTSRRHAPQQRIVAGWRDMAAV